MKKTKNILLILLLVVIPVFSGYYIGCNIETILSFFPETYFNISPFTVFGIACLSYAVSIIIHELSHAIAFKVQGMSIRTIMLGPFVFINKGKWKCIYNYNKVLKTGGMVIPIIPSIKNESDLLSVKKKYSCAILVAPLVSLFAGIFSIFFVILIPVKNLLISPCIFVFLSCISIENFLINISSLIKTSNVLGDYPAAKQMKKDSFFVAQQIYSYMYFMENHLECRKNSLWLVNYISDELKCLVEQKDGKLYEIIYLDAVNTIIMEDLIGFRKNKLVEELCNYYLSDIDMLIGKGKSETHKILFIHILYWLNAEGNRQIEEYIDLCGNLFENKEIQNYYNKQLDLIIKGQKGNEDLLITKNIKSTSLYSIFRIFEGFYFDELQLNLKHGV